MGVAKRLYGLPEAERATIYTQHLMRRWRELMARWGPKRPPVRPKVTKK